MAFSISFSVSIEPLKDTDADADTNAEDEDKDKHEHRGLCLPVLPESSWAKCRFGFPGHLQLECIGISYVLRFQCEDGRWINW